MHEACFSVHLASVCTHADSIHRHGDLFPLATPPRRATATRMHICRRRHRDVVASFPAGASRWLVGTGHWVLGSNQHASTPPSKTVIRCCPLRRPVFPSKKHKHDYDNKHFGMLLLSHPLRPDARSASREGRRPEEEHVKSSSRDRHPASTIVANPLCDSSVTVELRLPCLGGPTCSCKL